VKNEELTFRVAVDVDNFRIADIHSEPPYSRSPASRQKCPALATVASGIASVFDDREPAALWLVGVGSGMAICFRNVALPDSLALDE